MNDELVLIDTSVWIDYFRHTSPTLENQVEFLLDHDRVALSILVLAELCHGARDKKEIALLKDHFESLHRLDESPNDWLDAGMMAFAMKKSGKDLGLADCYLAVVAKKNTAVIYSLDRHFTVLKNAGHAELYDPV